MSPANVLWTDDFSHDYFSDSTYAVESFWGPPNAASIIGGKLVVGGFQYFARWHDERAWIQQGFSLAKVWADIESCVDGANFELLVGFHMPQILLSLSMGPGNAYEEWNNDGTSGGPMMSGATPGIELNLRHTNVIGNQGPDSPTRDLITEGGRVQLVIEGNGQATVTSPDGSTNTMLIGADVLEFWFANNKTLYPSVIVGANQNDASNQTVVTQWGYEIDYDVPPPPVATTVRAGAASPGVVPIG